MGFTISKIATIMSHECNNNKAFDWCKEIAGGKDGILKCLIIAFKS